MDEERHAEDQAGAQKPPTYRIIVLVPMRTKSFPEGQEVEVLCKVIYSVYDRRFSDYWKEWKRNRDAALKRVGVKSSAHREARAREEVQRHLGLEAAINAKLLKDGISDLWMIVEPADVPEEIRAKFEAIVHG